MPMQTIIKPICKVLALLELLKIVKLWLGVLGSKTKLGNKVAANVTTSKSINKELAEKLKPKFPLPILRLERYQT